MGKNAKIFVLYKCSPRVISEKEYFSSQVDRMTHSLNIHGVFPKPLLSLLNEFMNKVAMMTRIGVLQSSVAIVFSNTNFHSSGLTWLEPWLSAQSANSENQQRFPYMAPYSRGINQLSGSRLSILDWLHHYFLLK